jgi:hypothetical protein
VVRPMGQPEFRDGLNSLVLVVEPYNQTFQLGRAYKACRSIPLSQRIVTPEAQTFTAPPLLSNPSARHAFVLCLEMSKNYSFRACESLALKPA